MKERWRTRDVVSVAAALLAVSGLFFVMLGEDLWQTWGQERVDVVVVSVSPSTEEVRCFRGRSKVRLAGETVTFAPLTSPSGHAETITGVACPGRYEVGEQVRIVPQGPSEFLEPPTLTAVATQTLAVAILLAASLGLMSFLRSAWRKARQRHGPGDLERRRTDTALQALAGHDMVPFTPNDHDQRIARGGWVFWVRAVRYRESLLRDRARDGSAMVSKIRWTVGIVVVPDPSSWNSARPKVLDSEELAAGDPLPRIQALADAVRSGVYDERQPLSR